MKKVTFTALVPDDTNQNDFKTWLKSCPVSFEGGQTISWENVPAPEAANEGADAPVDAPAKAVGE